MTIINPHVRSFYRDKLACNAEEVYENLIEIFKETILRGNDPTIQEKSIDEITMINTQFPMRVNHACIWNSPEMIGELCIIEAIVDQLAVVSFKNNRFKEEVGKRIYRLEDLD